MNERQRDRFLYAWSRRRTMGRQGAGRRGTLAGAVVGVIVAGLSGASDGGSAGTAGTGDAVERLASGLPLTWIAVPLFAGIGRAVAVRHWRRNERRFRLLLIDAGVVVPRSRPPLRMSDRAPVLGAWAAAAFVAGIVAALRGWFG